MKKKRSLIKEEIGDPLKIIHNDFRKPELKPVHPIVYIAWIAIVLGFVYLMYKAYAITK